jgi:hypothetical protein
MNDVSLSLSGHRTGANGISNARSRHMAPTLTGLDFAQSLLGTGGLS